MSFQSRMGLFLIFLTEIEQKVVLYKVFEFLCCSLVLNRNKDSVILRLKIDKQNKRPPSCLRKLNKRPGRYFEHLWYLQGFVWGGRVTVKKLLL